MSTNFSTVGGVVTKGETFAKLIHHLRESQDMAFTMKHLHSTEGNPADTALANGWNLIGELIGRICAQVTSMATSKLQ